MRARFLLPQLTELRFVHESPVVKLCNGLLADALSRGFERLEILAPRAGSVIAEIRAYKGEVGSQYFELPASMHQIVVRRFKAMARMRRARPVDTQGIIRFQTTRTKPIDIRVTTNPGKDGQTNVIMNLPVIGP
jgi:type II secretory ATPase GspE/PulE/Tfp pilus assembly ATPase PilB-like protein